MPPLAIYSVSGSSNSHQSLVLRVSDESGKFTSQQWGTELTPTWQEPEIVAIPETRKFPKADVCSIYLPGLLVATEAAALTLGEEMIELLPAKVDRAAAKIVNPLSTIHRFREHGAIFLRVPSGAVILLNRADFYAEDIPAAPSLFWLHDGNFPRFLLCTAKFISRTAKAGITGLTFTELGYATTDA